MTTEQLLIKDGPNAQMLFLCVQFGRQEKKRRVVFTVCISGGYQTRQLPVKVTSIAWHGEMSDEWRVCFSSREGEGEATYNHNRREGKIKFAEPGETARAA